ncbi:hypothetical protein AVEN_81366-1 [Araneus ventricosus]|uniref:Uncharacterized protein n=1 Tax=Araneus ventricosus TaxID=182803 RepID=A0A4Y2B8W0_ARAVE|nr:hypothetical protein AVEN_81366-1 [Araneus ventricosus]
MPVTPVKLKGIRDTLLQLPLSWSTYFTTILENHTGTSSATKAGDSPLFETGIFRTQGRENLSSKSKTSGSRSKWIRSGGIQIYLKSKTPSADSNLTPRC